MDDLLCLIASAHLCPCNFRLCYEVIKLSMPQEIITKTKRLSVIACIYTSFPSFDTLVEDPVPRLCWFIFFNWKKFSLHQLTYKTLTCGCGLESETDYLCNNVLVNQMSQ